MLISSKPQLISTELQGNNAITHHIQDNKPIKKYCHEIRLGLDKSFSRNRFAMPVASIPSLVFFKYKHFTNEDGSLNWKEINRWLQTDEGREYKI